MSTEEPVDPETAQIHVATDQAVSFIRTESNVRDYLVPVGNTSDLKLLIYIPGYQVVLHPDPSLQGINFSLIVEPPAVERPSTGRMMPIAQLAPNGTFEQEVPPGIYDVSLLFQDGSKGRTMAIQNEVDVEEGQTLVIERP